MPFDDLREPDTGAALVRLVDTESVQYEVARKYQIRLTQADLDDPATLAGLARAADTTPKDFLKKFGPIVNPG
jgi:6-phosphofructokinase 1